MIFSLALSPAPPTDIRRDATVEAVAQVMPSVVNIATLSVVEADNPMERMLREFYGDPKITPSRGSGVIIDEDGYILTNLHVVERAREIQVKLSDEAGGAEYEVERIFTGTLKTDLAVLKIIPKKKGEKFRAVRFAKDDDLLLGETVIALGNPFGLGGSISRGILSSKRRAAAKDNEPLNIANWLQTDAAINPGNSGGPLVNLHGELIGINNAVLTGAQGIGFAIPIKEVRDALSEIFMPETSSNPRWFGARVQPGTVPLVLNFVQPGSPAEKAGLRAGDKIISVNGKAPKDFIEFMRFLRDEAKPDFSFAIQRGGETKQIDVRLVPFPELIRQKIGADVQELTPELAQHFGLRAHAGLLVARVEKGSPADKVQLQPGFVLAAINGTRLGTFADAAALLANKNKGDEIQIAALAPQMQGKLIAGYTEGVARLTLR